MIYKHPSKTETWSKLVMLLSGGGSSILYLTDNCKLSVIDVCY